MTDRRRITKRRKAESEDLSGPVPAANRDAGAGGARGYDVPLVRPGWTDFGDLFNEDPDRAIKCQGKPHDLGVRVFTGRRAPYKGIDLCFYYHGPLDEAIRWLAENRTAFQRVGKRLEELECQAKRQKGGPP